MEEKDFEPAGLIPRSIIRTVERFRQQLRPETIALGIQEFRISRYQVRVSVRYFFILLLLPIAINWAAKNVIIKPLVGYFWNTYGTSLFLNNYQAERAFKEMRDFESQLFFEMLLSNPRSCPETAINLKEKEHVLSTTKTSLINLSLKKDNLILTKRGKNIEELTLQPSTKEHSILPSLHESRKQINLSQQAEQKTYTTKSLVKRNEWKSRVERINSRGESIEAKTALSKISNKNCKCIAPKDSLIFKSENLLHDPTHLVTLSFKDEDRLQKTFANKAIENKDLRYNNYRFINAEPYNSGFLDRVDVSNCFEVLFQEKTYLLAEIYNQQSITALSNMFGDCIMIISIILLLRFNAPQFTILKSFLIESFYSFNDAIKCFYIILITDFLVGFHSPRGWEIVMEMLLRHLGLPENEEFILLFVGTFPVFLDTAFKYWIFRYLNKISPSTVATYHSMIE